MKYYHWTEHGRLYRSYLLTDILMIEIKNGDSWLEVYSLSQTAIRGCLGLTKIDPDLTRLMD